MSEAVFHVAQLGRQAGTFAASGASVAATKILPVAEAIAIELDRASMYPDEDYGRNVKNHAARGHHGARGSTFPATGEATFEQLPDLLEQIFAGSISPTGGGPFTWVYPFEAVSPTLKPYTWEAGSETSQDQYEAAGCLIDELTLGYDDLDAPGAHPWTFDATVVGLTRDQAALTASLTSAAVESLQGHLTVLKEGTTGTAFASLAELSGTLVSFTATFKKSLVRRLYGGTTDIAVGWGFSEKATMEFTAKVKVSATSKSDLHDIWNSAGASLGERRWRVSAVGAGTNVAHLDLRAAMFGVAVGERDGERVYEVTGEGVDDSTLAAPAALTVVNSISTL